MRERECEMGFTQVMNIFSGCGCGCQGLVGASVSGCDFPDIFVLGGGEINKVINYKNMMLLRIRQPA